jgi:hypothetical protein
MHVSYHGQWWNCAIEWLLECRDFLLKDCKSFSLSWFETSVSFFQMPFQLGFEAVTGRSCRQSCVHLQQFDFIWMGSVFYLTMGKHYWMQCSSCLLDPGSKLTVCHSAPVVCPFRRCNTDISKTE